MVRLESFPPALIEGTQTRLARQSEHTVKINIQYPTVGDTRDTVILVKCDSGAEEVFGYIDLYFESSREALSNEISFS